jgi:trk system potassium uptake protein
LSSRLPTTSHADYDTVLTYGSVIVIAGRPEDVERFVDVQ